MVVWLSAVLVRIGLQYTSTWVGTFISLAAGLLVTVLLALAFQREAVLDVSMRAVVLFGVIGILNFPMGRFFNYVALGRLGVARSTPILASVPFFAVLIAVLFAGETLRPATAAGIGFVLAGLYVTVTAPNHAEASATPTAWNDRRALPGIAFAFSAAIAYGSSQVLTRYSVGSIAPPLVGAMIALFWGTLGFGLLSAPHLICGRDTFRKGAIYFITGGICSAASVMLMFEALRRGQVVVVSPVLATNPLFTLVMASLLLRGVEHITTRVVLGAVLVVCGVAALAIA